MVVILSNRSQIAIHCVKKDQLMCERNTESVLSSSSVSLLTFMSPS